MGRNPWAGETIDLSLIERRLRANAANHAGSEASFHPVLLATVLLCPFLVFGGALALVLTRLH